MLCLEANSASAWEGCSVLAFITIGPIVSINLYSGFCSIDFHCTSTFRFINFGSETQFAWFFFVEYETVIITSSVFGLLVICVNTLSNFVNRGEIEWCTFYGTDFSSRNRSVVNRNIKVCINLALQFFDSWSRIVNTG